MKQLIQITFICLLIGSFSTLGCKKNALKIVGCMDPTSSNYNPSATEDNGTCQYTGNVTFWAKSNELGTTVSVGGKTGSITSNFPTVDAACGSTGCANFTLPVGSYTYTATSTLSNWSGTVTVTKNGCSLVLLQPQITRLGTNYYVAKTGSNSNAGTLTAPYLTIQKGLDIAKAGDTVFVKAGTYQEYVTFNNSGTASQPIVLKNYGNEVVLVDAQNIRVYSLYALDKSYITIDGINGSYSKNYTVRFAGCSNITYKNSTITNTIISHYDNANGSQCLSISGPSTNAKSTNILIENISTVGGNYGAFFGSKLDGVTIKGGKFTYANIDGICMQVYSVTDTSFYNRHIVIDGVEASYNQRQGIVTFGGLINSTFKNFWSHHNGATGLQIEDHSIGIVVEDFLSEYNSLSWSYETGVWIDDSEGVIVRRGVMRHNQTGFRISLSDNVLAYHLLIYSNQDGASDGMINSSGADFSTSTNVRLFNSVLYSNSTPLSQRGSFNIRDIGSYTIVNNIFLNDLSGKDIYRSGTGTVISNNNIIYNTRPINAYFNSTNNNLEAYKIMSGQESNSINLDPLLIDPSNLNFKLKSNSPAINKGINVGLTTDYLGHPLNGLPDIGAYEY